MACDKCNDGIRDCPTCLGAGWFACVNCGGCGGEIVKRRGRITYVGRDCPRCEGGGAVRCLGCKGAGRTTCKECR